MDYLNNLCFLCLMYDKTKTFEDGNYLKVQEELIYFVPSKIIQESEVPKHICESCLESLNKASKFRKMCLKNIVIFNGYARKLTRDSPCKYVCEKSTTILDHEIYNSDIVNEGSNCDIVKNEIIQIDNMKQEVKEEFITEPSYSEGDTEKNCNEINNVLVEKDKNDSESPVIKITSEPKNQDVNVESQSIDNENQKKCFSQQIYKCKSCDLIFIQLDSLLKHERLLHFNKKSHVCDVCEKRFSKKYSLTTHYLIHTGEKRHTCDVCQKSFTERRSLTKHKLLHSGLKSHMCNVCQKSYTNKAYLIVHSRIHTGEKPYACDICFKTFRFSSYLVTHKRIHNGEKIYKCDVCQKTFAVRSNLATHKLTHSGEKPYHCHMCPYKSTHSTHLKIHIRSHTGEKPFECKECFKFFTTQSHLNIHFKMKHC